MHFSRFIAALALLVALLAPKAKATDINFFAVGNNAFGATNFYTIVPAVGGKVAVVRTLHVLTDLGPGRVTIYTSAPPAKVVYDSASGTNLQVVSGTGAEGTNGFTAGDTVIVQTGSAPYDKYTRARVAAVTTTNIQLHVATAPAYSVTAGTLVYRQNTNQVLVGVTNASTSINNGFIVSGQRGYPFVIDVWTTAAGAINAAGGTFEPQTP